MKTRKALNVALSLVMALGTVVMALGPGGAAYADEPADPVRAECFDAHGNPLNPPPPTVLDRADPEFPRKAQEYQDACVANGGTAKFTLMRAPLLAKAPDLASNSAGGCQDAKLRCGEENTITVTVKDSIDGAPVFVIQPVDLVVGCEHCDGLKRLQEIERLRAQGEGGTVLCPCTFQLERDPACTLHNPCPEHAMGAGGYTVTGPSGLKGWHPKGASGWIPE